MNVDELARLLKVNLSVNDRVRLAVAAAMEADDTFKELIGKLETRLRVQGDEAFEDLAAYTNHIIPMVAECTATVLAEIRNKESRIVINGTIRATDEPAGEEPN